jgi:hypothetical protein
MTQTIINLGTGGAALNGQNGSTTGADSNDALFLDWSGASYVYLPGVASNHMSVPDEAALDITGDIDIRVQVAMDDWTPASQATLVGKYGGGGERSYQLVIVTGGGGALRINWTTDGTTGISATSTVTPTITDGAPLWVRVTLDVDNGASGYDAKFFTSPDGVTWTQLGATVTGVGTTSIFSSNRDVFVGLSSGTTGIFAGKVYRAQVLDGIDGTPVLDIDTSVITTGAATSFNALTGQTVTINRGTSGRKSVAVVSPVWLFGTDDYMEVADNDLLDFGASDSFTVLAVVRQWATPATGGAYVSKQDGITGAGYRIQSNAATLTPTSANSDGVTSVSDLSDSALTAGAIALIGQITNRTAQTLGTFTNTTPITTTSISAVGSLTNAFAMRVGRRGGSSTAYQDFELLAVAVFRRVLSAAEISAITAYYQARLS